MVHDNVAVDHNNVKWFTADVIVLQSYNDTLFNLLQMNIKISI